MTRLRLRSLAAGFVALSLLASAPLRAQAADEPAYGEKSLGTAVLLGLDPLPADSLYYSGRTKQAHWNLALGVVGAGLIAGGFAALDNTYGDTWVDNDAATVIGIGFVAYVGSLVWDGIAGIQGTAAHNREVREARRATLMPIAMVNQDGTPLVGVHLRF